MSDNVFLDNIRKYGNTRIDLDLTTTREGFTMNIDRTDLGQSWRNRVDTSHEQEILESFRRLNSDQVVIISRLYHILENYGPEAFLAVVRFGLAAHEDEVAKYRSAED